MSAAKATISALVANATRAFDKVPRASLLTRNVRFAGATKVPGKCARFCVSFPSLNPQEASRHQPRSKRAAKLLDDQRDARFRAIKTALLPLKSPAWTGNRAKTCAHGAAKKTRQRNRSHAPQRRTQGP